MLHWMLYCLLLNNVYRTGDVFFRSWNCPKTWIDQILHMHPRLHSYMSKLGRSLRRKFYSPGMEVVCWNLCFFWDWKGCEGTFLSIYQMPMKVTRWRNECSQISIILNNFNKFIFDMKIRLDTFLSTFLKDHNFGFLDW